MPHCPAVTGSNRSYQYYNYYQIYKKPRDIKMVLRTMTKFHRRNSRQASSHFIESFSNLRNSESIRKVKFLDNFPVRKTGNEKERKPGTVWLLWRFGVASLPISMNHPFNKKTPPSIYSCANVPWFSAYTKWIEEFLWETDTENIEKEKSCKTQRAI